jgi:hypothetical protein
MNNNNNNNTIIIVTIIITEDTVTMYNNNFLDLKKYSVCILHGNLYAPFIESGKEIDFDYLKSQISASQKCPFY